MSLSEYSLRVGNIFPVRFLLILRTIPGVQFGFDFGFRKDLKYLCPYTCYLIIIKLSKTHS